MLGDRQKQTADRGGAVRRELDQPCGMQSAKEEDSQCREQITRIQSEPDTGMKESEHPRPKLQLKNGAMADVECTLNTLGYLRYLLEGEPKLFDALLALVQDRPQDADPEQVRALPKAAFFGPDGGVRADVADVLLSALEVPGDGPVLVNPFKLENEREKLMVERTAKEIARADREFGKWLLRNFRRSSRD